MFVASHLSKEETPANELRTRERNSELNFRNLRHHLQIAKIHQEHSEIMIDQVSNPSRFESHTAQVSRAYHFTFVDSGVFRGGSKLRKMNIPVRFGKFVTSEIQLGRDPFECKTMKGLSLFSWKIFFS